MANNSIQGNEEAVRNISGLRLFRTERGITQKELAQLSGVGTASINCYENGKYIPKIWQYNKLAKVFGWELITKAKTKANLEDIPMPQPEKTPEVTKFKFEEGHNYQISAKVYTEGYHGGNNTKNNFFAFDNDYVFRYEGKQGIHHVFREIRGNWTQTYTDAQLIGKKIKEVDNEQVQKD